VNLRQNTIGGEEGKVTVALLAHWPLMTHIHDRSYIIRINEEDSANHPELAPLLLLVQHQHEQQHPNWRTKKNKKQRATTTKVAVSSGFRKFEPGSRQSVKFPVALFIKLSARPLEN
jgi:hypothetical protein